MILNFLSCVFGFVVFFDFGLFIVGVEVDIEVVIDVVGDFVLLSEIVVLDCVVCCFV